MTRRAKKRFAILVAVLTVLGAGVVALAFLRNSQHERFVQESYTNGIAAYEAGDYELALDHLKYYVSENQTDGETLFKFADARLNVPREDGRHIFEGMTLMRHAADLLTSNPEPLRRLIELYGQIGYNTERLEMCERLLRLNPQDREALEAKVRTLYAMGGNPQRSLDAVDELVEAYPDDPTSHEWRFRILDWKGATPDELRQIADQLLQEHPGDIGFALLQAKALANAGNLTAAQAAARRAIDLPTSDAEQIRDLVSVLDRLGMEEEADYVLAAQIGDDPIRSKITSVMIERAWKRGNMPLAFGYLPEEGTEPDEVPDDLLGWSIFLRQTPDEHRLDSAEFANLQDRGTNAAEWWIDVIRAQAALYEGDLQESRNALRHANEIKHDESVVCLMLGLVNTRIGELDRATSWLEKASFSDPVWATAHQALANAYIETGRLDEAKHAAELALQVRPTAAQFIQVADVYIRLLESDRSDAHLEREAINVFEQLLERSPDNPSLLALIGRAYLVADQPTWAEPLIEDIIAGKEAPDISYLLRLIDACNQYDLKHYSADLLALAGSEHGTDTRVLLRAATQLAEEDRFDAGRRMLNEAIESAEGETEDRDRRMALAVFLDNYDDPDALDHLVQVADRYPQSATAQRALLDSRSAWRNESVVKDAIERLRTITGEDADGWRTYEARRLITFDPSPSNASQVLRLLAPTIRTNPSNPRAQALASEAYLILDDRDSAIESLTKAVDSNHLQVALYPRLIELLQQAGRSREAERRLIEFSSRQMSGDQIELRRRRARLLTAQGMWSRAISELESMGDQCNANDIVLLGHLYTRVNDWNKARSAFESIPLRDDVTDDAIAAVAEFLASIGEFERGLELFEDLPGDVGPERGATLKSRYFERAGRLEAAEGILADLASESGRPEAWKNLAWFYIRHEAYDKAKSAVESGLAAAPEHEELKTIASLVDVLSGGELSMGLAHEIASTLVDDETSEGLQDLVEADLWYQEHPDQRSGYLSRIERITRDHPRVYPVWRLLVSEYVTDGRIEDALDAAQAAAQSIPGSPQPAQLAAQTAISFGRYDLALPFAKRWRDLTIGDPFDAEATIAFVEWQRGNVSEALAQLERWTGRIVQNAPVDPRRMHLLASLLAADAREQEAHELVWPLAQQDPKWAMSYANITESIDDVNVATQWLDRVEPLLMDSSEHRAALIRARFALANRLPSDDAYAHIIEIAEPVVTDDAFPVPALLMVAACHRELQENDQAEALYRLALEREPQNAVTLNDFAFLLRTMDTSLGEAESMARQAVEIARANDYPPAIKANFLETLGTVLVDKQDYESAIIVLEEGSSLDPTNLPIKIALAEALSAVGRLNEARSLLRKIDIESGGNDSVTSEMRKRIAAVREQLDS